MKLVTDAPTPKEDLDVGELPEGWTLTTVGEVFQIVGGGTPSTKVPEFWKGDIPWITSADILGIKKIVPRRNINQNAIKNSAANLVPKGSIIIVTRVNLGRIALSKIPISFSQDCHALIPKTDAVDPEFALYYLSQVVQSLKSQSRGTTISGVTVNVVSSLPFLFPPLAEQQRIVARVEALLMHVNAARDRLSRMPLIMKRFRQAVLAAACSGRLTRGWREGHPDVESGSQLLVRLNESRKKIKKIGKTFEDDTFFEQLPELPITWTWSTIQQIAERVTVGHVGPMKNEYRSEGIPFLRCQNVRENYFDARGLVYISPQFHESLKKSALEPGDLVVVRSGNVGVCCIIPESLTEANCSDLVVVKKPFGFVPKFGAYYVNSLAQKWIDLGTVGIALSHFNTKSVATLPIPIPPLAEQHEIVRRVGSLFERADAIEQEVSGASRRAEALTQAILGKAFRGDLVGSEDLRKDNAKS